ncbi:MAG: type III-B CRISPR module RAMP protein Cmr1 [Bacteroidetes bacterium 4572_77]|nr:MAG: type III-B CRISPR module RAMP protein Cmr1 [Bacteroidetes bacterium 4572_77]
MIQTIKFKCETITPLFLAGADGKTPELRAPSIKGALRFWWRALNANLVNNEDYTELKRQESAIFGGTDSSGRSKVIISIDNQTTKKITAHPTPHKERPFSKSAFAIGSKFEIAVNVIDNTVMTAEQVKSLFIIVTLLGGIGNRSRRGFGSFKITEINDIEFEQPNDVEAIEDIINSINPSYPFANISANYPFVKSIEIGQADSDITLKIGKATHSVKENNGRGYGDAMGDSSPRFSSPIYVSVIKKADDKLYPIITTLNTVPPNGRVNVSIQQTFKSKLL